MSKRSHDDDSVGYKRPPKATRFKKGASGNPSGRPKKPSDLASRLLREIDKKVVISENGRKTSIKKAEGLTKQLVARGLSGNLPALRFLFNLIMAAQENKAAQRKKRSCEYEDILNMTDAELWAIAKGIDMDEEALLGDD